MIAAVVVVVVENPPEAGTDDRRVGVGLLQLWLCCSSSLVCRVAPIYSSRSSNSGGPIELQGRLHPAAAWAAAQLSRDDDR